MKKLIANKDFNVEEIIDNFFTNEFWDECENIKPSFKNYINNFVNDLSIDNIGDFSYGDYQIENYEFEDLKKEIIEGYLYDVLINFVKEKFKNMDISSDLIYNEDIIDLLKTSLEEEYYLDEDSLIEKLEEEAKQRQSSYYEDYNNDYYASDLSQKMLKSASNINTYDILDRTTLNSEIIEDIEQLMNNLDSTKDNLIQDLESLNDSNNINKMNESYKNSENLYKTLKANIESYIDDLNSIYERIIEKQ